MVCTFFDERVLTGNPLGLVTSGVRTDVVGDLRAEPQIDRGKMPESWPRTHDNCNELSRLAFGMLRRSGHARMPALQHDWGRLYLFLLNSVPERYLDEETRYSCGKNEPMKCMNQAENASKDIERRTLV